MDSIEEAKVVVRSHEEYSAAGNVDGVVSNMAEDVVLLAPDAPLVVGREGVRVFYEGLFSMGDTEFYHDYAGAEEIGDTVILHGIARGSMTPPGSEPVPLANNFILTLKRDESGTFQFWRGAFAGSGS